jgi:pimeloyl-ACP methyl ester carboxylesterase
MRELKVQTPDGIIWAQVQGQGEPLVMIRGLGRWSVHWHGLDKALAEYFQVITLDARGLGQTTRVMTWKNLVSDLTDDVICVLDELKIPAAHILGTSLGGMIALDFAIRYPTRVKKLCVINSSLGGRRLSRMRPNAFITLVKAAKQTPEDGYLRLARLLTSSRTSAEQVSQFAESWIALDQGVKPVIVIIRQLLAAARFAPRIDDLHKIKAPILVMVGEDDQFVSPANSIRIHQEIPHSTLCVLAHAGHEPHVDQPQKVLAEVCDFLKASSQSIS